MSTPTGSSLGHMIGQYVSVRDALRKAKAEFALKIASAVALQEKLEATIMEAIQETGATSVKSAVGTAYLSHRDTASIADGSAFRRHVIDSANFDLLDWKANSKAVEAYIKEHEAPPPGVNFRREVTLGVRAPTKKAGADENGE